MATPRSELINLHSTPYYHCMARCVRRNYLCGLDNETNKDYSHRKFWILQRLKYLTDVFAVDVCAYAIMSNHYHLILHVNEKSALNWSESEVRERWARIFPKNAKENLYSKKKPKLWREQLASISWFMRCLNEDIARQANKEENCHGRFWEGRFKSQALLDEKALLSAMVYVDLNPIRAGVALTPEDSDFTSIQQRINDYIQYSHPEKYLEPMFCKQSPRSIELDKLDVTPKDYIELVEWSGRQIREDKRGAIPNHIAGILNRLQIRKSTWPSMMRQFNQSFGVAVGAEIHLLDFSKRRQRKPFGRKAAQQYFLTA